VVAPRRPGFGVTVIRKMPKMQLAAEVTLDFAPEGVAWRLDCPARKVVAEGST